MNAHELTLAIAQEAGSALADPRIARELEDAGLVVIQRANPTTVTLTDAGRQRVRELNLGQRGARRPLPKY
jgi:hypothetical protein